MANQQSWPSHCVYQVLSQVCGGADECVGAGEGVRIEQADGIQVYQIDDIRLHLSKIEAYSFDN